MEQMTLLNIAVWSIFHYVVTTHKCLKKAFFFATVGMDHDASVEMMPTYFVYFVRKRKLWLTLVLTLFTFMSSGRITEQMSIVLSNVSTELHFHVRNVHLILFPALPKKVTQIVTCMKEKTNKLFLVGWSKSLTSKVVWKGTLVLL